MDYLFTRGKLSEFLNSEQEKAINEIRQLVRSPESGHDAELVERFVNRYTPLVPTVHWDQGQWSTEDAWIPPEKVRHLMDATSPVRGTAYVWRVPFEGDAELFNYQPSQWTTAFPKADLAGKQLIFRFEFPRGMSEEEVATQVKQAAEYQKNLINDYLQAVHADVKRWVEELKVALSKALERRKEELAQRQRILESLQREMGENDTP